MLRDRPESLKQLYAALTSFVSKLGQVEVVAKQRYVLFRSTRVFTDLSIMKDTIRVAIHVGRQLDDPMFIKVVGDGKQVTHVVKIASVAQLEAIKPYLREAHEFSLSR